MKKFKQRSQVDEGRGAEGRVKIIEPYRVTGPWEEPLYIEKPVRQRPLERVKFGENIQNMCRFVSLHAL